jgi:hypothetical protein
MDLGKMCGIWTGYIFTSGLKLWPLLAYCAAIGGTKSGRRNRSTRRKSVVAPFCPTHDQTRVAAVEAVAGFM